MVTVHDISLDADAFRRAYPNWPGAEPGPLAIVPPNIHQGEYPCTAQKRDLSLRCSLESGHGGTRHLDGRTNQEWDGPVNGLDEDEDGCPDCEAPAGWFCHRWCPRYAEPVHYGSDGE